jgi:predicted PurR-regulated permease PerM
VMAALFHVIPYFGPIAIALAVFVASFEQFGTVGAAAVAAVSTLVIAGAIGTVSQSWIASRIARMNATASFVSLLFFGWLWGVIGLFLAIPIAVIAKVVIDSLPTTRALSDLMSTE